MATMNFEPAFSRLEQDQARLLEKLGDWRPERLYSRPSAGGWSAAEVLDHVIRTEKQMCDAAIANLPLQRPTSLAGTIRIHMVMWLFHSPLRVKVPNAASTVLPGDQPAVGELTLGWQQERRRLRELIRSPLATQKPVAVVQHPVAGWISLGEVLQFLSVHIKHHGFQLERLRRTQG